VKGRGNTHSVESKKKGGAGKGGNARLKRGGVYIGAGHAEIKEEGGVVPEEAEEHS